VEPLSEPFEAQGSCLLQGERLHDAPLLNLPYATSSEGKTSSRVALEQFFDDDDAPWNYMMAIAILYSLPPVVIFYALRHYVASGLTVGGLKG
jgi:ABC-type glycerol-3-phosphate transport system permease component